MNVRELCLVAALGAIVGCGDANAGPLGSGGSGGAGGTGGTVEPPPAGERTFRLSCTYDVLQLNIPIELVVELTETYSNSRSTEATFSATVVLDEESVAALIGESITTIDIVSVSVTSNVTGATPTTMTSVLGSAPVIDLDLQADTDDNGMPGPHRFELDPVTATSDAAADASEVAFGLDFDGISLILGDFSIPTSCLDRSLVGVPVRFPVSL